MSENGQWTYDSEHMVWIRILWIQDVTDKISEQQSFSANV